jgi:hypothetical protein
MKNVLSMVRYRIDGIRFVVKYTSIIYVCSLLRPLIFIFDKLGSTRDIELDC